jgi:hypothetical protein
MVCSQHSTTTRSLTVPSIPEHACQDSASRPKKHSYLRVTPHCLACLYMPASRHCWHAGCRTPETVPTIHSCSPQQLCHRRAQCPRTQQNCQHQYKHSWARSICHDAEELDSQHFKAPSLQPTSQCMQLRAMSDVKASVHETLKLLTHTATQGRRRPGPMQCPQ